jgi:hypothetical protein
MTSTIVIWSIIAALCKASFFIGADPSQWYPINQMQQQYVEYYHPQRSALSLFNEKEMRSWASTDYNELNSILKKEGFSIELQPFSPLEGFGVVSILDVTVNWLYKGQKSIIYKEVEDKKYPAVYMTEGFSVVKSSSYKSPIIRIRTKSNDVVCMTIADQTLQDFELLSHVQNITKNIEYTDDPDHYDFIKFPMVDLDQEVNIKWLLGMRCPGYNIEQALQQTKFKMNEEGARVKSAVAIALTESAGISQPKKCIIVDEPFYVWIERPVFQAPIFVGYIAQEHWKDPKNLDV